MEKSVRNLDWTLIQSFCAVASEGSLSGAARSIGQSQPTVGRHIKAAEAALGVELFRRVPRGLELTPVGLEMLTHARDMEVAFAKLQLTAEGQAEALSGTVRITASVVMSHFVLPKLIAEIRRKLPEVQLELVPSDATENLIFREADIAVRMYRPTQLDVISRHVADQPTALYASHAYLERVGTPASLDDLQNLDIIGFDKNDLIIRLLGSLGIVVDRDFFSVRCDDQAAYWHLVRAGCGIGGMQTFIGDNDPTVIKVMTEIEMPSLPIWLAAPDALRTNARIRRVWDLLADGLREATST